MATTAVFMLVLYPSLLLWLSQSEFDLKSIDFNDSEPTPLDVYRARRAAQAAAFTDSDPLAPTGSDQ